MNSTTRRLHRLPMLACLATVLPAQKEAEAIVEPSTKVPRGKLLEWQSREGKKYWYRLPKDIDAKNPPDLLLMLHGTGLNHGWSFWNYPILGGFRRRDIVVSPDGMTPGQGDTFNFVQGPKDGDQIVGLIADFKQRFPIGRVYLYGHSQGAFFTYWFAGEHPELIDGIVAHAGNVLNVKHGKLSKQKVGIGILHGRADAVVPVDCAIRSEQIYRAEGYEKLKLEIVDGLTEQSGHWPLPVQVARMLDWLDAVSTQSAKQAMRIAQSELQRPSPDLASIAEQVQKAKKLLPKADDADKKELPAQMDALREFLDASMALLTQRLLADGQVGDAKAAPGSWVFLFQAADRAFDDQSEWKKAMSKPRDLQNRHDKAFDKALKGLDKNSKASRAAALSSFATAFLSPRVADLRSALEQACRDAKPPDADTQQQLAELVAARETAQEEARRVMAELLSGPLQALRERLPLLFAVDDETGDGK